MGEVYTIASPTGSPALSARAPGNPRGHLSVRVGLKLSPQCAQRAPASLAAPVLVCAYRPAQFCNVI